MDLQELVFFTKGQSGSETHALRVFIQTQMPEPKIIIWKLYQKVVDKDEKVYYKCNRQKNNLENCLKKE